MPQNKQVRLSKQLRDIFPEYENIQSRLEHLVEIFPWDIDAKFAFSVAFVQAFLRDTPSYELTPGNYGASRSNWTYHTAMTISQTCKLLDLTCKFETHGKRDAVIETRDEVPEIILVAEWEWDYEDIFGKGKELDKLKSSCKASKTAEAFLLTYCPEQKYLDYLQRIVEEWISAMKTVKAPPSLFLHTVIFEEKSRCREFVKLRTVEINTTSLDIWNDRNF